MSGRATRPRMPWARRLVPVALLALLLATGTAPAVLAQRPEPGGVGSGQVRFRDIITSTVKLIACEAAKPSLGPVDLSSFAAAIRQGAPAWTGSGTVIRADGLILTNAHVALDQAQQEAVWLLVLRTVDDRSFPEPAFFARAVLSSPADDLDLAAIVPALALDGSPLAPGEVAMRPLPMIDAGQVSIGDDLHNIGYPGVGGELITITQGAVSGFDPDPAVPELGNVGWIKTDAILGGGISGGTTVNDAGEFIGVPTQLREIETRSVGQVAQINLVRPVPEGFQVLRGTGAGEGIPALAADAPVAGAGGVTLGGTVVSADTGAPVAGAWVIVLAPGVPIDDYLNGRQDAVHAFAVTGADGAFLLPEPVVAGEGYGVLVVARGFRNAREEDRVLAEPGGTTVATLPPVGLAAQR